MSADWAYFETLPDFDLISEYLEDNDTESYFTDDKFPPFEADYSSSLIVENIPKVGEDKKAKLTSYLQSIFNRFQKDLKKEDIVIPMVDSMGLGFCFIKFADNSKAEEAMKTTQGYKLDAKHTFKVNFYTDLKKFAKVSETYEPLKPPSFVPRPDPKSWLSDSLCRDQFVLRSGKETEVYWNAANVGEQCDLVYGGERAKEDGKFWCVDRVFWSERGTYLATIHPQGIKLWGGDSFEEHGKIPHSGLHHKLNVHLERDLLSFSPCENYLVTYYSSSEDANLKKAITVWDIKSEKEIRSFELKYNLDKKFQVQALVTDDNLVSKPKKGEKLSETAKPDEKQIKKLVERQIRGRVVDYKIVYPENKSKEEPYYTFTVEEGNTLYNNIRSQKIKPLQDPNRLKWSHDGKYLARIGPDFIAVYSLPSMALLDKKYLVAKDILDFEWSPSSNLLSYWSPAVANHPALINILKIPEREDICSRKLFDVTDGEMIWQNEGDYLCVAMVKTAGKKRSYVLMFFRVKDPSVPVEQIEFNEPILKKGDKYLIHWEPSGERIVVMYGEQRNPNIAFYSLATGKGQSKKNELAHLFTISGRQCTEVHWSPAGGHIAMAYFQSDVCQFQLFDVANNVTVANLRHDRCNSLRWDPSGRYIVTTRETDLSNALAKGHKDDGYNIYTFQGQLVLSVKREKIFKFAWRPRPKDLKRSERAAVMKNIRRYEKNFEREDKQRKQELIQAVIQSRYEQAEEFFSVWQKNRSDNQALKTKRIALRNGYDSDDDQNYKIDFSNEENIISQKEQIIKEQVMA